MRPGRWRGPTSCSAVRFGALRAHRRPRQIPPVVAIPVQRWNLAESAAPSAPEIILGDPGLAPCASNCRLAAVCPAMLSISSGHFTTSHSVPGLNPGAFCETRHGAPAQRPRRSGPRSSRSCLSRRGHAADRGRGPPLEEDIEIAQLAARVAPASSIGRPALPMGPKAEHNRSNPKISEWPRLTG